MKNHDEQSEEKKFPQSHLNDEAKESIHSNAPQNTPPAPQKKSWKGRIISIATAIIGLVVFSVLTGYIISETEQIQAEQLLATASEKVDSAHVEMREFLVAVDSDALLKGVNGERLKSAELSMKNVNADSSISKGERAIKLNQKLESLKEYNQIVPFANELQQEINVVKKMLHERPFEESLQEKIVSVKNELTSASKRFDQLESQKLKTFFNGRYSSQLVTIDETYHHLKNMKSEIELLNTAAKEQSMNEEDFEKKVTEIAQQLGSLSGNQAAVEMESQIKSAKTKYYNIKKEMEIEKQRQEEIRREKLRKEEERKEEEIKAAEAKTESEPEQDDELYPMEFTKTTPDGHVIKYSRDLKGIESYIHYDEIAKKYGGRYYYTPSSDMAYIFKNNKVIATISMVSTSRLEYKELFIELNTYNSNYTKEEFSNIVNSVIQTGEPYEVEKGQGGEALWLENGVLLYHVW